MGILANELNIIVKSLGIKGVGRTKPAMVKAILTHAGSITEKQAVRMQRAHIASLHSPAVRQIGWRDLISKYAAEDWLRVNSPTADLRRRAMVTTG